MMLDPLKALDEACGDLILSLIKQIKGVCVCFALAHIFCHAVLDFFDTRNCCFAYFVLLIA